MGRGSKKFYRPLVDLNGRRYRLPVRPVVVVCIDGCAPDYIAQGLKDGILRNIKKFMDEGFTATASGVMPSFTNPNNISIVTGSPPSVHGITGNFFLDPETGAEIMMNDAKLLRSETLLAEFSKKGARVVVITAKDKLRKMLCLSLSGGICFSSEKADQCTLSENGIDKVLDFVGMPLPDVYSAELSLFVLEAGINLLQSRPPDLMYLSLTDYIQHKYAPGTEEANSFYRRLDDAFGRMAALGAVVALTADHGMNDKSKADGSPNAIFLQDLLDIQFGAITTRVICPITDPYVRHHGSLGSFVTVYCRHGASPESVIDFTRKLSGVENVLDKKSSCVQFDLPPDRIGDVIVIGDAGTVIGSARTEHDLSGLEGVSLRSHGGASEQEVPFIISVPLSEEYASRAISRKLRNFEIFDFAINGIA